MVGRTSRREQPNGGIDDGLFVDHAAERAIVVSIPADLRQPMNGGPGQFLPKLGAEPTVSFVNDVMPVLTKAAPGICSPITSIIIWFELAVP